jgi:tetratricopeptide (TPR) repeat protein
MTYKDPTPVLLRIAKLEERLKEKPKTRFAFFKDSSKVLSICAFIVSILTTVYSWRKDNVQAHEAARREFYNTMQQTIDIGLKNYDFQIRNKDQPNIGAMSGWFNTQTGLLQNKAVQQLAVIDDASMFDYIVVGYVVSALQPARATTLFKKAIEIGLQKKKEHNQVLYKAMQKIQSKVFGDKIDISLSEEQRVHDLASTYASLGQVLLAQRRGKEAKEAYEAAMQLWNDANLPEEVKRYQISITYKFWADAEGASLFDCNSYLAHLKQAEEYFPEGSKVAENWNWSSIEYELSHASCASDGKFNFTPNRRGNAKFGKVSANRVDH